MYVGLTSYDCKCYNVLVFVPVSKIKGGPRLWSELENCPRCPLALPMEAPAGRCAVSRDSEHEAGAGRCTRCQLCFLGTVSVLLQAIAGSKNHDSRS